MGEHPIEGPRHVIEVQCLDEQAPVADLAARGRAQEASKLLLAAPLTLRGLTLERAERSRLTLRIDDLLYGVDTEVTDQLVLQVLDAPMKPQLLHLGRTQVLPETGTMKATLDVTDLGRVEETRKSEVPPVWAPHVEEVADARRTSHRHDGDAISVEIYASALGQCFERVSVTDTLHEHHRTLLDPASRRGCSRARQLWLVRQASAQRFRCPGFHVPSLAATALRRVFDKSQRRTGWDRTRMRRATSTATAHRAADATTDRIRWRRSRRLWPPGSATTRTSGRRRCLQASQWGAARRSFFAHEPAAQLLGAVSRASTPTFGPEQRRLEEASVIVGHTWGTRRTR